MSQTQPRVPDPGTADLSCIFLVFFFFIPFPSCGLKPSGAHFAGRQRRSLNHCGVPSPGWGFREFPNFQAQPGSGTLLILQPQSLSRGFRNLWDCLVLGNLWGFFSFWEIEADSELVHERSHYGDTESHGFQLKNKKQALLFRSFMPLSPSASSFPLTPNPKKHLQLHNYPSCFSRAISPAHLTP